MCIRFVHISLPHIGELKNRTQLGRAPMNLGKYKGERPALAKARKVKEEQLAACGVLVVRRRSTIHALTGKTREICASTVPL